MSIEVIVILCSVITQVVAVLASLIGNWVHQHNKKAHCKNLISCKKREIWDIQKQITSIVASGDETLINSEYVKGLSKRLKTLKQDIAELNAQLKPKDKDTTKLNVTESIKMLQESIEKLGGKK